MEQRIQDASGYTIFSQGDAGAAHVLAHRMLDEKRYEEGYQRVGAMLEGRSGQGSGWTHLAWHMLVFELALGKWHQAHRRFRETILPVAAASDEALTDAPAALWRLALHSPNGWHATLPWDVVSGRAKQNLGKGSHFVELHHLLAMAGAGDIAALDRWLAADTGGSLQALVLRQFALGLRAFADEDHGRAVSLLTQGLGGLHLIGGSRAQNELLSDIRDAAKRRYADAAPPSRHAA